MCIVPDFVVIHESKLDDFIQEMISNIKVFYGDDVAQSQSYMRIINVRNFLRIKSYIDDSVKAGAKIVHGGKSDENENFIEPTLVTKLPFDSPLMQHEIFGPVLPIVTYSKLEDSINLIRSKEKPLALYICSKNKQNISQILQSTSASGTCINNNVLHFLITIFHLVGLTIVE